MLFTLRKAGEQVRIGDDIKMKVISISGSIVKLGWESPKSITIDREEIYQNKKAEKQLNDKYKAESNYDIDAEQHFNSEEEYVNG